MASPSSIPHSWVPLVNYAGFTSSEGGGAAAGTRGHQRLQSLGEGAWPLARARRPLDKGRASCRGGCATAREGRTGRGEGSATAEGGRKPPIEGVGCQWRVHKPRASVMNGEEEDCAGWRKIIEREW